MTFRDINLFLIVAIIAASCNSSQDEVVKPEGLEFGDMDTTVRAQDDFYRFANGGWLDRTSIPADQGSWSCWSEVYQRNDRIILELLTAASSNPEYIERSDHRKVADFFAISMDSLLAEKVGWSVLEPAFETIDRIRSTKQLSAYLVAQELAGGGAYFQFYVAPDFKHSDRYAPYLVPAELGLPDRDYYIKADERSKQIRDRYVEHIADMLQLTGYSQNDARKEASHILFHETRLAKATLTKEEKRDLSLQYHKMLLADVGGMIPSIEWTNYFNGLQVVTDSIIVAQPEFMQACDELFSSGSWNEIKAYLKWTLLRQAAPYLNHAFSKESFLFNENYLNGIEKMKPRWKRGMIATDNFLGDAIGQMYVEKTFPPEAKRKALEMVENIKLAMADRIKQLDWMTDSTKEMALRKLSAIQVKIGYPDQWKSYAGLVVDTSPERASYYQNIINAKSFQVQRAIDKLGDEVDRMEWHITPQTVDAYYNGLFNEIVFPAGILQPPFFNYRADEAINYGAIGAFIGHEISHGFDDQGSRFDAYGNLKNRWGEEDLEKFRGKGKALAEQYNAYEPLEGIHLNGEFTLGENIGDLGGVTLGYEALQRHLRENGRPGLIDGFTPEQRYFLSWATIWRAKFREDYLLTMINTNLHVPNKYRVIVPLSNMKAFYDAFDVKEGDDMYRKESERVQIW